MTVPGFLGKKKGLQLSFFLGCCRENADNMCSRVSTQALYSIGAIESDERVFCLLPFAITSSIDTDFSQLNESTSKLRFFPATNN